MGKEKVQTPNLTFWSDGKLTVTVLAKATVVFMASLLYSWERSLLEKLYFTLKLFFHFLMKRNTNDHIFLCGVYCCSNNAFAEISTLPNISKGSKYTGRCITPLSVLIMTLVTSEKKSSICNFMSLSCKNGDKTGALINNEGIDNVMKICHVWDLDSTSKGRKHYCSHGLILGHWQISLTLINMWQSHTFAYFWKIVCVIL